MSLEKTAELFSLALKTNIITIFCNWTQELKSYKSHFLKKVIFICDKGKYSQYFQVQLKDLLVELEIYRTEVQKINKKVINFFIKILFLILLHFYFQIGVTKNFMPCLDCRIYENNLVLKNGMDCMILILE